MFHEYIVSVVSEAHPPLPEEIQRQYGTRQEGLEKGRWWPTAVQSADERLVLVNIRLLGGSYFS